MSLFCFSRLGSFVVSDFCFLRKNLELGEFGGAEDLEGHGKGETVIKIYLYLKVVLNNKSIIKNSS